MRRPDGPERPGARGPVAAPAVLGVPVVQPPFLDHVSASEARKTGGEADHRRRAGQAISHDRTGTARLAPYPLVGPCPAPEPSADQRPGTGCREPTISLDFHQQTSLDWLLSIWGGVSYGASEACSGREPRCEAGSSSAIVGRRQRSRSATRARQGVREVLTVTLVHHQTERAEPIVRSRADSRRVFAP